MWTPTYPTDPMGQEMTMMDVPSLCLKAPNVSIGDMNKALSKIKPSVA